MRIASYLIAAALFGGAVSAAAEANHRSVPFLDGRIDATYRSWTVSRAGAPDATVSETAVPIFVRKSVGPDADVSVRLPIYSASLEADGTSDLSGLADAVVAGSYRFDGDRYRLDLEFHVPGGSVPFTADEEIVADVAANRIFAFPIKRFGEGFDAGFSFTRGFSPVRGVAASAGAGYLVKGEYDFVETEGGGPSYKPGDEIVVVAGAEAEWAPQSVTLFTVADLRYRSFRPDRLDGRDFYDEGDQFEVILGGAALFPRGGRIDVGAFLVFKGDGSEGGSFGAGSLDSLSLERYLLRGMTGDFQRLSLDYSLPVGGSVHLLAGAAMNRFGEYPSPVSDGARLLGSARTWEIGGGVRAGLSRHYELTLRGAWLTGGAEDGAVDLSGFGAQTSLRWTY